MPKEDHMGPRDLLGSLDDKPGYYVETGFPHREVFLVYVLALEGGEEQFARSSKITTEIRNQGTISDLPVWTH